MTSETRRFGGRCGQVAAAWMGNWLARGLANVLVASSLVAGPLMAGWWLESPSLAAEPVAGVGIEQVEGASYRSITLEEVKARRDELARRIAELDRYLQGGGSDKASGWKSYLKWPELVQITQGDGLELPAGAEQVAARFYTGQPGLEFPRFVAVRDALSAYASLASGRKQQPFDEQFTSRRAELAAALRAYRERPTSTTRAELSDRLAWFESLNQLDPVVRGIREEHRYPNLMIRVSDKFVSEAVARDVDERQYVEDVILKTHVRGTAHTVGRVTSRLVPDSNRAAIQLLLAGQATTPSVGYQRPVRICSTSRTGISACQTLYFDPQGAHLGTTDANCRTQTQIHSISAPDRMGQKMIEKIAWRRAGQQKSQAEAIASRKAEVRVESMFRREAEPVVAKANARLRGEVRRPLVQRNVFPKEIHFSTTHEAVHGQVRQALAGQWSAPTAAPAVDAQHQLSIQVHETAIANTAETAIGGFQLTDVRAAELVEELTGSVPEELKPSADKDPWSITFALKRPVQVSFDDDSIEIAVEGRQFTRGDRVLAQPMRIAARYRPVATPEGVLLQRQGDLEVTFPGRETQRLGVREVAFKTFMEGKWGEIFKSEIRGQGLELPGQMAQMGRRPVQAVQSRHGWLSLGWN